MSPHGSAKANIKQGNKGQWPEESHYIMNTLSFPLHPIFPYPITSKTAPTPHCSLKPTTDLVAGVNWDNCMVWHWATTMPVQLFVLWGNRLVHTFHRDFCREKGAGNVSDTAPWLLSLRDLKVAGYGVLSFINKYSCSRVTSYLVWWISKNSMLIL